MMGAEAKFQRLGKWKAGEEKEAVSVGWPSKEAWIRSEEKYRVLLKMGKEEK